MSELLNKIIRAANFRLHRCAYAINTLFCCIAAKTAGVRLGKNANFWGWTSFFRYPCSTVNVGQGSHFNSSPYGNRIGINHKCIITTHTPEASLLIGSNVGMSSTTINCWNSITIGDNVRIGANCIIMDGDFHLDDTRVSAPRPIVIEDNVWLGAGVTVLKGVRIGRNSIIGMNSTVTKDIPANCIAAGNPCNVKRHISSAE